MPSSFVAGRVGRAVASWLLVAAIALAIVFSADQGAVVVAVVLTGAWLALGIGLLWARTAPIPVVVVALVLCEVSTRTTPTPAAGVALLAGGLLVAAELAYWSCELCTPMTVRPGVDARRWQATAAIVSGSVVVAAALELVAAESTVKGTIVETVGVVAAVAVIALLTLLARRSPSSPPHPQPLRLDQLGPGAARR